MDFTDGVVELTETELRIASALADMAIARGGTFDDFQTPVYLRGLVDLDSHLVARACDALGREPRADYTPVVPPVGTIRQRVLDLARVDAAAESAAKLLPAPVSEPDEKPYFCLECRDEPYGWRVVWCRGVGSMASTGTPKDTTLTVLVCARRGSHPPHTYTERCTCYGVNPVSAAHRRRMHEAIQRRAQKARS